MFKKTISILLVLVMLLLISVSAFAVMDNAAKTFTDVENSYWGKDSIDYISSKGYMVGYGDRFGILDNVTEGQYVAVLCRIFGYENQSPLTCEEPARELGLLKENESINVTAALRRSGIAKYTIRAFELLNPGTTYPDYLDAYRGMVTDYESLGEELKTIVLKCIEKGLLVGGPDGSFNPNDETTRAQAAAFIHRILEQSERKKVKPVFAEPDPEFEAFMASPDAKNYCSIHYIDKIVDGKIIFGGSYQSETGETLLPAFHNKDSNKEVYNFVRDTVMYAKNNGHYLRVFLSSDSSAVVAKYFENKFYGEFNPDTYGINLCTIFDLKPYKLKPEQTKDSYYTWVIGSLIKEDISINDWKTMNYKSEDMLKATEIAFKSVYGNILGKKIFDYAISEYDMDHEQYFNYDINYLNKRIEIREDLGGLEISNNNGEGLRIYFTTSK